jgi:hypothetical protein
VNGYSFTTHVRSVLHKSRLQSGTLNHEYVGTEHILLSLLAEPDSIALAALKSLGVDTQALRDRILGVVKKGRAEVAAVEELPYTSRAKKVLELAMTEARELGHNYVGTEHLLLGLVREEKGIAAMALTESGVVLEAARREVVRLTRERGIQSVQPDVHARGSAMESSGALRPVAARAVTSHASGDAVLRWTLGGVSIVAGASTLVRLLTSDDVISWYGALESAIELTGGALLLHHRTMRTGGWILLGIFAITIVTRLAQFTFPGPVLIQAATTLFLLTRGRMSFRMHQTPGI